MIVSFCCFRYQTKKIFRQVIKIFLSTKNFFFLFRKTSFSSYHFFISFYLGIIFFYWIKLHRKFAEAWQFFYFYSLELECILIFFFFAMSLTADCISCFVRLYLFRLNLTPFVRHLHELKFHLLTRNAAKS